MPKPIIYLLLLITIGACNQKLDPKESIVCELTEFKEIKNRCDDCLKLVCPKKDINKIPIKNDLEKSIYFEDLEKFLNDQNSQVLTGDLTHYPKAILVKNLHLLSPQKHLMNTKETDKNHLVNILPLGKCTLHFTIMNDDVYNQLERQNQNDRIQYIGAGFEFAFCKEYFNIVLDDAKKNNYLFNERIADYLTSDLKQNIKSSDTLYKVNIGDQSYIYIIFK